MQRETLAKWCEKLEEAASGVHADIEVMARGAVDYRRYPDVEAMLSILDRMEKPLRMLLASSRTLRVGLREEGVELRRVS